MNKPEFLEALEKRLSGLPLEDIEKSKEYYSEMIDDRVEDGLSEEEAVEALGDIESIVSEIFSTTPLSKLVREKVKPSRKLRPWEIVLIVLGSPIWFSLALAAVVIVFAFYIVLWSLIIALYAVDLAFIVSGPFAMACSVLCMTVGNYGKGIFGLGCGLFVLGLGFILIPAAVKATQGMAVLSKKIWNKIKSLFIRRSETNE